MSQRGRGERGAQPKETEWHTVTTKQHWITVPANMHTICPEGPIVTVGKRGFRVLHNNADGFLFSMVHVASFPGRFVSKIMLAGLH